jgi:MFS family permease
MQVAGYGGYIALLTAGYYYNLTFVQLGLIDLGTNRLGMPAYNVSLVMAVLALVALAASVVAGLLMDRRGWSGDLRAKLRLLTAVIAVQLLLTTAAPLLTTPAWFGVWVVVCATSIGIGMPVTFSLMADLIPVRDRGFAAAVPAGLAFFVATLYPRQWEVEQFSAVMATAMLPAVVVLAVLALRPSRLVDQLARQDLGPGRFTVRPAPTASTPAFALAVAAMFAVFFIDSLGFLRIIDTPAYISTSWQSPDLGVRLFIAVSHVVGAAMAGVLYTTFHWRWLLVWVYGLFGFTHLLYTFHLATAADAAPPLVLPGTYVLAVAFYTTLNFALWPDLSTADTIGTRCAVGVGVAGWLASFLSTSLALASGATGVTLLTHLRYVDALALLLLLAVPVLFYAERVWTLARREAP